MQTYRPASPGYTEITTNTHLDQSDFDASRLAMIQIQISPNSTSLFFLDSVIKELKLTQ